MTTKLKQGFDWLADCLIVSRNSPEVIQAQYKELLTKVPLLYVILVTNSISLAFTHYKSAPAYLSIYIPIILSVIAIARSLQWLRFRSKPFDLQHAQHQLKMTVLFAVIVGVIFSAWGISLYSYGDMAQKGHVTYFMSITVIGVIVCLINLPLAALSIIATVGTTFVVFFVSTGNPVFVAISINFALVSGVLILVTFSYFRAFSEVVESRQQLNKKHTETQRLNRQNEQLANQDGLTQLANRRSFLSHLSKLIEKRQSGSTGNGDSFVVGLIDLDGFKPVNDVHGHAAGDRVLWDVGVRLKKILDDDALLARMGGDEYAIIINKALSRSDINELSEKITSAIKEPFSMRTGIAQVSGSCGFAIYPDAGNSSEQLMERADFALYHAKKHDRGSSVIFSSEHEKLIKQKSKIEQALIQAIANEDINLHYQAIVDGKTKKVIAMEALARWQHNELGFVPPDQFIPLAEKMGTICDISISLFKKAVRDASTWPKDIYLSFNLSAFDIANETTINKLVKILEAENLPSSRIQFEITETSMMRDLEVCAKTTEHLRNEGFKVAIDDFGSGYSSLGYIHKFYFDNLKIDRTFINEMITDSRSQGVVKTILELCINLGVNCIAEGIETEEQKELLLSLGCNQMQGYLFCKPAPLNEIRHLMEG